MLDLVLTSAIPRCVAVVAVVAANDLKPPGVMAGGLLYFD